jgi:hypothetical protein
LRAGGVGFGGQVLKNFTSLMLFWVHNLNNQIQAMWDIGAAASGREEPGARWFWHDKTDQEYYHGVNIPPIVMRLIVVGLLVPTMTEVAMRMWNTEDKHGFWYHVAMALPNTVMSGYAGVRDVGQFLFEGKEPSFGIMGSLYHYMKMASVAAHQTRPSPRLVEYLITLMGMITGAGSLQTGRTVGGAGAWMAGTEHPRDPIETLRLLTAGHARARKIKR